jgi:hypothetical protein
VALTLTTLAACEPRSSRPLVHEVYVWQRAWSPALADALRVAAPAVAGVRVLAGEYAPQRSRFVATPDFLLLAQTRRPLIAVVRLDGRIGELMAPGTTIVDDVLAAWRGAGARLEGIEIDFDCPRSRLGEYLAFLQTVRARLRPGERLSITALPDWLASRELESLLETVDGVVLQVHAVERPPRPLFDADRAWAWIQEFSARTPRPFHVALPAYGSRVVLGAAGEVAAVESEVPLGLALHQGFELTASPVELQQFVGRLSRARLRNLRGVAWFRLPLATDRRAWGIATWLAVIRSEPLVGNVEPLAVRPEGAATGARDVWLVNRGRIDLSAPAALSVEGPCSAADGVGAYQVERATTGLRFHLQRDTIVKAGRAVPVGWAVCDDAGGGMRLEP